MKKLFLAIFILTTLFVKGQDSCKFKIGGGFGMGFFYPQDVNNYISDYINHSNIQITEGSSDMFMNIFGHINLSYTFSNRIGIRGKFEIAIAPKIITVTNNSGGETFNLVRFSPGASLFYTIPVSKVMSIGPEIGIFYHNMQFKSYSANTIAPRALINLCFVNNETIRIEGFIGFDFAKANTHNQIVNSLDYTGLVLGSGIGIVL